MKRTMAVLVALATFGAPIAEAQSPEHPIDTVGTDFAVLAPTDWRPTLRKVRPFDRVLTQPVGYRSAAAADEAIAIKSVNLTLRAGTPLIASDWLRIDTPLELKVPAYGRPIGEIFCAWVRSGIRRLNVCLRDADADGRWDSAAQVKDVVRFEPLRFEPISPVAFRRLRSAEGPEAGSIGLITSPAGPNRLRIQIDVKIHGPDGPLGIDSWHVLDSTVIDQTKLPAEVVLGGAKLRVVAFDTKSATVEALSPFNLAPFALVPNDPRNLREGYRMGSPEEIPGRRPA
jgi:hypothetical protein